MVGELLEGLGGETEVDQSEVAWDDPGMGVVLGQAHRALMELHCRITLQMHIARCWGGWREGCFLRASNVTCCLSESLL